MIMYRLCVGGEGDGMYVFHTAIWVLCQPKPVLPLLSIHSHRHSPRITEHNAVLTVPSSGTFQRKLKPPSVSAHALLWSLSTWVLFLETICSEEALSTTLNVR